MPCETSANVGEWRRTAHCQCTARTNRPDAPRAGARARPGADSSAFEAFVPGPAHANRVSPHARRTAWSLRHWCGGRGPQPVVFGVLARGAIYVHRIGMARLRGLIGTAPAGSRPCSSTIVPGTSRGVQGAFGATSGRGVGSRLRVQRGAAPGGADEAAAQGAVVPAGERPERQPFSVVASSSANHRPTTDIGLYTGTWRPDDRPRRRRSGG